MTNDNIKATYISHTGSDLTIVNSARVSFNRSSQELNDKDKKLIRYLYNNDHMSPFEHCVLTVMIECPIYISKQIMRHRTGAYSEISRRYTSDEINFYIPQEFRKQSKDNKQASEGSIDEQELAKAMVEKLHYDSTVVYDYFINKLGICREQARGVLPQNLMTKFYMTMNLRNWIHFINLRIKHDAQAEVRIVAQDVLNILKELYPVATEAMSVNNI